MNKRQVEDRARFCAKMESKFGMQYGQSAALLRANAVLYTWSEHEGTGAIQRDEETEKPFWYNTTTGRKLSQTPDREKGAQARVCRIIAAVNALNAPENHISVKFSGGACSGLIELTEANGRQINLPG